MKEIKVKSVFESIPGNPVLTLEDGREVYVGSNTKEIKRDKSVYKAKALPLVDMASLKVPGSERYKFTLTTPCLEQFSDEKDCVSEKECTGHLRINNSSKLQVKPNSDQDAPAAKKNEGRAIER